MRIAFAKVLRSIRVHGPRTTLKKLLTFPVLRLRDIHQIRRQFRRPAADIFTEIHATNFWGSSESRSGTGSTLSATKKIRQALPGLFRRHSIGTVFDAPCGDFNWMSKVVAEVGISYVGADIVRSLIATNRVTYGSEQVRFEVLNITTDRFPRADLWLCRDCLIHLSNRDIHAALQLFVESEIPLMLTTTYPPTAESANTDIYSGEWRRLDLLRPPFSFPTPVDTLEDAETKMLILVRREQVRDLLPEMRVALAGTKPLPTYLAGFIAQYRKDTMRWKGEETVDGRET